LVGWARDARPAVLCASTKNILSVFGQLQLLGVYRAGLPLEGQVLRRELLAVIFNKNSQFKTWPRLALVVDQ
jgi:hypothetical protein